MSKNAMAGAVALVGTGICMIGGAMLLQQTPHANATASVPSYASTAIVAAAAAQMTPTVVWMGMTEGVGSAGLLIFTRLWSDGTLEARSVRPNLTSGDCAYSLQLVGFCASSNWIEVPPPPAGNGFACRSDVNGDRRVDGADLASLLGNWGENMACEPEPTYPCLDLSLAGGGALR